MTQYRAGAAILIASLAFAYINRGDPLLSVALAGVGVILCGFAAVGRHEGGRGDPA